MKISVVLLLASSCALVNAKLLFSRLQKLASNPPQESVDYPIHDHKKTTVTETYPETEPQPQGHLEAYPTRRPNYGACLQIPEVKYRHHPRHVIPFILKTVFNELGRPEPPQLVNLINSKLLRQVQLNPRNVAPILQEVHLHLKKSLDALPLPNGYKHVLLSNIVKYFDYLPRIRSGERQPQELYCHARALVALVEAYKGSSINPDTLQKFYDATVLLTRLISRPNSGVKTLEPSDRDYDVSLEVNSSDNVQPSHQGVVEYPEQPQYNDPESEFIVSLEISVDDGSEPAVGVYPSVEPYIPTHQPVEEYEVQPAVDEYDSYSKPTQLIREDQYQHPMYNVPRRPQHNYSIDIDLEEEEYERHPSVPVILATYQPVAEYEPQPTVDEYDSYSRPVQSMREVQYQHPRYNIPDRTQYNYSVDIDLEEEEYWQQPGVPVSQPTYQPVEEYEPQPTVDVHDPYTRPNQPMREAQHQHPKFKVPDRPQYNYSIDIDLEEEEYWRQPGVPVSQPPYQPVEEYEPQPTVDYYDPSTRPIQPIREAQHQHPKFKIPDRPQYNYSIDIDLEEEEYWRQPGVPVSQPTYQPIREVQHQHPSYNVPRRPQYNYSIDIDLEEEEYERQPSVPVILPTYQPIREVQHQHPSYNVPRRPQYNYSIDIDLEEEEFWRQRGVPVSQPTYQLVEEYEPQPTVDVYDPYTRPIQPIKEVQHQHPKFKILDRPQYNYSIDIDLEEEEYWRQPGVPVSQPTYQPVEEYEPQPTVDEYDPYTRPIQPIREAQHQHTKLKIPDRPQYNYSIDIDLEEEEYWRQPSAPVSQPTYGVQLTEYEDKFANQPQLYVEDLHQSIEPPNYQRVRGHKLKSHRPDGSLYEKYSTPSSVMKKMEYEEQPELYEPYHPNGPGYDTELEDQPQPVVDQPSSELDWIDSDEQTPMYISRPVSVENTVNSLQSILQRFVTGEQPLASLPNVIRSVGAVHRIRIDIKISIEKIVGTLVGYNPGVYDIVRQVYNLVSPILPNIPDDNSPGPHGTSTVSSVWQNTHRIISEVVKVILDALRRHHPSLLRVFRDVLPKLFRAVFLPSSAPPQVILKHVVFLVKLLEPIWDKLPHQADLSPPELVYHLYRIIKLIRQLVVVDKNFPQIPRDTSQANPLDGAMRKIYYLLKRDGDCVNRETVVQFSREIQNLKSAFPKIPASALKALQAQLPELVLSLKNSCSNSLIHRYVKDLESSLFRYWGIQEKEDVPDDLFVQPILKSIRLHDLEQDLWDNLGDYLAALVGPSASASLRASLAKLSGLIKRFFKRMIIYEPNDYEVKSVALRISNLLAGALSIPYKIVSLLRSLVIGGLQLIRDVIHGRREVHNVEDIIYGAANKIGGILSGSPIYQIMSHLPLMKLRGNILNSINQYTKQIADYQKSIRKFVAKIEVLKGVNKPTSRPLEQLLYRLPPIVKEMTTCSDILPYKSYDYFHKLLSSLSGRAIPRDLSYKLVNLISQVRGQRCADHVSLPESLRHLDTYLPGQSFKKWHAKFATRKAFTQIAFANSVNVRLKNHLLYTIQHLLGTIQPYVVTNQQTAGEFVNSVRDWASSLEHTINQPQQRHSVKRSVFILSAKFTAILRPQQKQPPQELTDKLMGLSNSILEWYQAPSPHPLRYHTSRDIQDVVKVLKSINQDVDTSQFQDIIELLVTYLQGYTVNKDNTLDNPSSHITSTILDLIGKDPPPQVKQQLIQRTKSILAVLRNKSACLSKYSSENAQREVQDYINYIQRVLRTNLGPENQYLLQHLLEKAALSVTSTAMRPSVYAVPAPYEYLRPSYVDTCSPTTRSVLSIIPTGEHSFSQLWNLNLITALDTVKKGILLFLDDYSGNELARNVKEFLDIVLSVVINDAISDSEKLPFAIRLALRINNGVVIPGNRDTLKSVRDIIDLTDLLSGIRSSYAQKDTRNVHPIVNSLVHKVSYLYGSAPSPQFAQSFHQLIEHVGSRNSQDGPELLRLIDRTTHSVRDNWGHVVTPAKRISLNLALRNLLVNIVKRISNSAEPISTWQSVLESFHHVAKVIAPNSNPNVTVDLLERVVYAIQESYQCRSSSHSPISKHLSNLLKHIGNIAYEGEGGHDFQQYTAFDHLLNNVMAIACTKAKPHDKADYIVQDYNKYLRTLGLPESFAKNQIQRLFSIMLHNLASSREVFYVNIQSVVLALVHDVFKTLRTPVTAVKEQRLTVLIENLLEVIKHNVFQEQQIQNIVKIVNSLLWYPNNEHLHFGLNNAFYQLLRSITEDNSYSRLPKVTELLRNIRVGLILSAVNHVPLTSTQILMASRLQPQLYPSLIKALDDLSRSLENRQSHQPDGPLFDALVNLVEEIEKVLVPTKKVQSVQQAKRVVVDDLTQIIQHYLPPQTREAVVMKTIGVIDEFINKLQIHFGIILPKPVRRAAAASGVPESTLLSNLSPAVLLAEFKGSAVNKFA